MIKRTLQIFGLTLAVTGCNLINHTIDGEMVSVGDSTKIYTYKNNGEKVTGTVIFYDLDPKTSKRFKESIREVKDGKRINTGYDYYPEGNVKAEYPYDQNGLISGAVKLFYPNGQLYSITELKDNRETGVSKEFREDGTQAKEVVFEDGTRVREYEFDESGKKIIPAIDRLRLITYQTGFYEYKDFNSYQLLYEPMVIMKWKNISDEPLAERIEIEGIFIDNSNGEEWSKTSDYFQGYSDPPLQAGLLRQSTLQSSVGFKSAFGIYNANISCQILINKQLYKTVKVKNIFLASNRM